MVEAVRHNSRFLRLDSQIEDARKHKGWANFHRCCGAQGLYFDDIERHGKGYSAISFRLEKHGATYQSFRVSKGAGRAPIDAVLSAFNEAVSGGFAVDPTLADLLAVTEIVIPASDNDWDALLGSDAPQDELMDLIG